MHGRTGPSQLDVEEVLDRYKLNSTPMRDKKYNYNKEYGIPVNSSMSNFNLTNVFNSKIRIRNLIVRRKISKKRRHNLKGYPST